MTTNATASLPDAFEWQRQPVAEALIKRIVGDFLARCPAAADLAQRMKEQTGTRFTDWVDHVELALDEAELQDAGFERDDLGAWRHPGGIFPRLRPADGDAMRLALKVDSVADYLATNQLALPIDGEPLSAYRSAEVAQGDNATLLVVERHGYQGCEPQAQPNAALLLRHLEALRTRRRDFATDAEGFAHTGDLLDAAIADLGRGPACDLFFQTEREFWERRNHAAQVQKRRQDVLGLGWANHDHHTYRSSRGNFRHLVATWEKLGFEVRERYHAGREAGWGAQIMEDPLTGIITFNDVDLSPDELFQDFAHEPLSARQELGTVGLWCGLHGDSCLQSGMHHLECQFDYRALRAQLRREHIKTMPPFSTLPHLLQAFTEGERWSVSDVRLQRLLDAGQITSAQADTFRSEGALGSHLENLERNQGFKGFNQRGVSEIIAATDPRKQSRE